jgi:hypothetical protein
MQLGMNRTDGRLGNRERRALAWAQARYRRWHKRFGEPFEAYVARRPEWVPLTCWSRWYDAPFRDAVLNEHVRVVRRLLRKQSVGTGENATAIPPSQVVSARTQQP